MGSDALGRKIPPGQTLTRKFPVTGERSASKILTHENYRLTLELPGNGTKEFTWAHLQTFPSEEYTSDIHCVTSWSRLDTSFRGIRLGRFLELNGINASISKEFPYVQFEAYSDRSHDTSLPLNFAWDESWMVFEINKLPLTPEHGFPLRIITPGRYFYKSLKWLKTIRLLREDKLGFWERNSSYHNDGDPWSEQRFDESVIESPDEINHFKGQDDFKAYQPPHEPRVFLKCNFNHWTPKSKDLRYLQLKSCNFREAKLDGIDFSNANLTLSKFPQASLSHSIFINTDLEGADLSKAILRDSNFENNAMSATVFGNISENTDWESERERLRNISISNPSGLLESQKEFLDKCGVKISNC